MKRIVVFLLVLGSGVVLGRFLDDAPATAAAGRGGGAGQPRCAAVNGDVNADSTVNLADAVTILGHLFLGGPADLLPLCASPGGGSGLPATGQTDCWSFDGDEGLWLKVPCDDPPCAGQDGALTIGCPAAERFVDHGDGTVTDTCTGLMWQQDTADVSGDGSIDSFGDTVTWCDANNYCDALDLAGHDDWRLPNARELQSIVDYGRINPSIDPVFGALPEYYWSSTTHVETQNDAWGVGFNVGYVGVRVKIGDLDFSFNYVRAVRSER
jgi:hypothetical protein